MAKLRPCEGRFPPCRLHFLNFIVRSQMKLCLPPPLPKEENAPGKQRIMAAKLCFPFFAHVRKEMFCESLNASFSAG